MPSPKMELGFLLNGTEPASSPSPTAVPSSPLSELSWPSRSPSPPLAAEMAIRSRTQFPTPPASQVSGCATPRSYDDSTCSSSTEREERPAKRRRTEERKAAGTAYLDISRAPYDAEQQPQLDRLLKGLRKKRRIVVVAGAGISVSAGIPDFRSSTGIFKTIKEEYNLKGSGKDLFDASVYRDDDTTSTFHHMVRQMAQMTKTAKPTPFHDLVARLAHEGRLMRLYTQNIDGLDTSLQPLNTQIPLPKKGPWPKCIQLHGGLSKMQCSKCGELADFEPAQFDGPCPPACEACLEMDHARTTVAGKRSHGVGRMRPRMVLYSESSPDEDAIGAVSVADLRSNPDAILVVGTSMKIPGVRRIVKQMTATVRSRKDGLAVWINNDPEPAGKEFSWDIVVKGTSDEVAQLAGLGKWDDPIIEVKPEPKGQNDEHPSSQATILITTPSKKSRLPTPKDSPVPRKVELASPTQRPEVLPNPASKGCGLNELLAKSGKAASKTQKPAARKRKPATKIGPVEKVAASNKSDLKLNFKVNKHWASAQNTAGPKLASMQTQKQEPMPMSELGPGSPKNNTVPAHKILLNGPAEERPWKEASA